MPTCTRFGDNWWRCFFSTWQVNSRCFSYIIDASLHTVIDIPLCFLMMCMCVCRTAAFLMKHLARMSLQDAKTGMHCKNLAIVWAPNLLKFVFSQTFSCALFVSLLLPCQPQQPLAAQCIILSRPYFSLSFVVFTNMNWLIQNLSDKLCWKRRCSISHNFGVSKQYMTQNCISIITTVPKLKLQYFGHITRGSAGQLALTVLGPDSQKFLRFS